MLILFFQFFVLPVSFLFLIIFTKKAKENKISKTSIALQFFVFVVVLNSLAFMVY